jgi:hypothetical protein
VDQAAVRREHHIRAQHRGTRRVVRAHRAPRALCRELLDVHRARGDGIGERGQRGVALAPEAAAAGRLGGAACARTRRLTARRCRSLLCTSIIARM